MKNRKAQIMYKIPSCSCKVSAQIYSAVYFWVYLASCLYYLFTVYNILTFFVGIEKYGYNIYIFWFSPVVSHFMLSEQSTTRSSWQSQQSRTEECDPPRAEFNLILGEPYCCPVLIFVLVVLAKAGGHDISANCLSHKIMEWFGLKGALKIL